MLTYVIYKVGIFSIKQLIKDNYNKYSSELWRPGNLPIGTIIKYTSPIFYIFV